MRAGQPTPIYAPMPLEALGVYAQHLLDGVLVPHIVAPCTSNHASDSLMCLVIPGTSRKKSNGKLFILTEHVPPRTALDGIACFSG